MKFQVGDKVIWTHHKRIGVVISVEHKLKCAGHMIAVDFGKGFEGHNCRGRLKSDTGYWVYENVLVLVNRDNDIQKTIGKFLKIMKGEQHAINRRRVRRR